MPIRFRAIPPFEHVSSSALRTGDDIVVRLQWNHGQI